MVATVVVVVFAAVITMVAIVSGPRAGARRSEGAFVALPTTHATRSRSASTPTRQERGPAPLLPTTATPLRVLEIGDSLGIDLGYQLQSQLDANGMARTTVASVGDSGLSNVTYLDWPAHLIGLLATDRPQIVVVFIGANDDQGLTVNGIAAAPGTPTWVEGYAGRVDEVLREATSAGARVAWIGMPPMANPMLDGAMQRQNAIYERESASFSATLYVSSTSVFNAAGVYGTDGDDLSGRQVALRTPDGVHLTPAGAAVLARTVIDAFTQHWHLSLAAPTSSTTAFSAGSGLPLQGW